MDMILSWSLGLPLILKHPSYGRTCCLGRVTIAVSNSDCLPNSIQSNLFSHLNWWIPQINNINDIKLFDLSSQTKHFVSTPSQQSAQIKDVNSFHPLSYHCSQVYNKKQKSSHGQIWDGQAGYIHGNAFTSIWFNHPFKESILFICFSSHLSTRMSWWSVLCEIGQIPSNWISLSINNNNPKKMCFFQNQRFPTKICFGFSI